MKKGLLTAVALLTAWTATAQQPMEIPIWPFGPPNSNELTGPEVVENGRVSNITVPVIYVHRPEAAKNTGAAVILCPGGGYTRESIEHEGHEVAKWLAENGVTGVVLKYRLPNRHHDVPLSDALQAIRTVRANAADWGLSPDRIGIAGFSAGGHLAASAATLYEDEHSYPNFAVLFYPVISFDPITGRSGGMPTLMGEHPGPELLERYSLERHVTADTPPMLFFHSNDDPGVTTLHSLLLYTAMKQQKVPGAVYIFPTGGHGWGFNPDFAYHEEWKTLMLKWLRDMKFTAE